jgi:hypothetical protein
MRKRRELSVVETAIRRVGFRRGRRAVTFAACWWIVTHAQEGTPPATVDEYAEWWAQSRAQAFRDQADYRAAFPEWTTPMDLAAAIGLDVMTLKSDRPDEVVHSMMGVTL